MQVALPIQKVFYEIFIKTESFFKSKTVLLIKEELFNDKKFIYHPYIIPIT